MLCRIWHVQEGLLFVTGAIVATSVLKGSVHSNFPIRRQVSRMMIATCCQNGPIPLFEFHLAFTTLLQLCQLPELPILCTESVPGTIWMKFQRECLPHMLPHLYSRLMYCRIFGSIFTVDPPWHSKHVFAALRKACNSDSAFGVTRQACVHSLAALLLVA